MQPTTSAATQTSPNLSSSARTSSKEAEWKGRSVEWKKTDDESRVQDTKRVLEISQLQQLIRECEERCPPLEKEKKQLEKEIDKLKDQIKRLSPSQQQTRALDERQKAKEKLVKEISQTTDPKKSAELNARLARTQASLERPQELPQKNEAALAGLEQELRDEIAKLEDLTRQLQFEKKTIQAIKVQIANL